MEAGGLDEAQKKEKLESAISAYRRAMELGFRDSVTVRHFVELLYQAGRGNETLEVTARSRSWCSSPASRG